MFVVEQDATFEALVPVVAAGGKVQVIKAEFNYFDQEAYGELAKELVSRPLPELASRLLRGWKETDGEGYVGMPMPFSKSALEAVAKKQPRFCRCVLDTYLREVVGVGLGN